MKIFIVLVLLIAQNAFAVEFTKSITITKAEKSWDLGAEKVHGYSKDGIEKLYSGCANNYAYVAVILIREPNGNMTNLEFYSEGKKVEDCKKITELLLKATETNPVEIEYNSNEIVKVKSIN